MTLSPEPEFSLRGRRLALAGFGAENRAVARWLHAQGLPFSVCDRQEPKDHEAVQRAFGAALEEWHLGPGHLDALLGFDVVFRTPGISALHPALCRARKQGTLVTSQTRLFLDLCPAPILGITGTKGKGTTTSLVAEALRDGPYHRVRVGGNIGLPPLTFLEELTTEDLVVLELSSFQLMDWTRSPHLALILSVTQDHLDYHATVEEYHRAKESLCRYQGAGDLLMVNEDCPRSRAFARDLAAQVYRFSARGEVTRGAWVADGMIWLRLEEDLPPRPVCPVTDLALRGRHNQANAAAAALAAAVAGASVPKIAAGLARFQGLEHRLERVGEYGGVAYYNDSLATTPDSAIAALESFDEPLVWIAGGSAKGADFTALGTVAAGRPIRAAILIGQEAPRLQAALTGAKRFTGEIVTDCASMAEAVAAARSRARTGEVVLLSPACASFGMFASYRERGNEFKRLVREGG